MMVIAKSASGGDCNPFHTTIPQPESSFHCMLHYWYLYDDPQGIRSYVDHCLLSEFIIDNDDDASVMQDRNNLTFRQAHCYPLWLREWFSQQRPCTVRLLRTRFLLDTESYKWLIDFPMHSFSVPASLTWLSVYSWLLHGDWRLWICYSIF